MAGMLEAEISAAAPSNHHSHSPSPAAALKILVVEDDPMVRQAFTMTLEDFGCTVLSAISCSDVLLKLAGSGFIPDLVISDYHLAERHLEAGVNGLDLIRCLRARFGRRMKSCIITGDNSCENLRTFSDEDVLWLAKPVGSAALADLLASTAVGATRRGHGFGNHPIDG